MSYCVCRLGSRLNFGKYKNQIVKDVLAKDPQYLVWIFANTRSYPSKEVLGMLRDKGFEVKNHRRTVNDKAKYKC